MELIDQHAKKIMEECKERARSAGLQFADETIEYIVTNRDMLDLSPKIMIPTLYDYWVHDVEVLKEYAKYKLYPSNPYETVINSRPAISYYNDNNPDWMNIMIFYHVIGHIDFFQNNILFQKTWNDDFVGQALADKRLMESLRGEYGRWVDYAIEFSRNADNLVGFFNTMIGNNFNQEQETGSRLEFYFDNFLQDLVKAQQMEIYNEIERYNSLVAQNKDLAESIFFTDVRTRYPEFQSKFERYQNRSHKKNYTDVMQFIHDFSPFLRQEKNTWIKLIMNVVRNTSMYFQPQIRTKIINEGWASYWHDKLFRMDDRIIGHESDYARLNANVTSISRVGLNPYAIGLRLIEYVEELADKGKISHDFQKIENIETRNNFNLNTQTGKETIFDLRKNFSDFMLVNTYTNQEFVDKHNLFVVGKRLNQQRKVYEYYVKSRKAADYKQMLIDSLYHPPRIEIDLKNTNDQNLSLIHSFENKQLIKDFIPDTLMGIEFLWGSQVQLQTTEIVPNRSKTPLVLEYKKVRYTMKDKKLNKEYIDQ